MSGKTILVVDDEEDVLNVLEKRLSAVGYSVIKADNGNSAISIAKTAQPSLILLDILMPQMDGGAVAAILQDDPLTKNIPIIFLTCLVRKKEERYLGEVRGKYFIGKPYEFNDLLKQIDNLIL